MPVRSPFSYRLLLQNKQVGPYDRRTIVGMRIKKLIPKDTSVLRSDGLVMTAAQLLADRFETADRHTGRLHSAVPSLSSSAPLAIASGLWPAFLVDFGGGLRAGALGFAGKGELRFQGDALRLSGQRKTGLWSRKDERIKIAIADIAALDEVAKAPCKISLTLRAGHPLLAQTKSPVVVLVLDDASAVQELVELVRASM